MRTYLILCFLQIGIFVNAKNEKDSLLNLLDKTLSESSKYVEEKENKIHKTKLYLNQQHTLQQEYSINKEIIREYQSYSCDSAMKYINRNIHIASELNNKIMLHETNLQKSFVFSLSGLFTQSFEILNSIKPEELPLELQKEYYFCTLRYYNNLIKYTNDKELSEKYEIVMDDYRDSIMALLPEESIAYQKEKAYRLRYQGEYEEAWKILNYIYEQQQPSSHSYAMASMDMAIIHHLLGNEKEEYKFLMQAAIADVKAVVKENEALLVLALRINKRGDNKRAYKYVKIALEDANFYNSRFRNTLIARVQPIIEKAYLLKIEQQSRNLKIYAILISLFVIAFGIIIYFIYRQMLMVSKARKHLRAMNENLVNLNHRLDEANLIKEEYIGYFMNQCSLYIDKLDEYRKNINRKIKVGQIDDLYKLTSSSRNLEKDIQDLHKAFDEVFLKLYPDFVEQFNALLREEERYKLKKNELNKELRIFALIRLGITDGNQIAVFLRYSLQTIYNYKSKVRSKAIVDNENFEEEVKKIGLT